MHATKSLPIFLERPMSLFMGTFLILGGVPSCLIIMLEHNMSP